jgi:hypothetical protein
MRTLSPDGRRWCDGFRVGDRVVFHGTQDRPGTITRFTPEGPADEFGPDPEFWDATLDDGERVQGYINEFDFLGVAGTPG